MQTNVYSNLLVEKPSCVRIPPGSVLGIVAALPYLDARLRGLGREWESEDGVGSGMGETRRRGDKVLRV